LETVLPDFGTKVQASQAKMLGLFYQKAGLFYQNDGF
jgi:hypothetical protein